MVFARRTHRMETMQFDDEDATIRQFLRSRSENRFNWITLDVGNGTHNLEVIGRLDVLVDDPSAEAKAIVGPRTLIVESMKLANHAEVCIDSSTKVPNPRFPATRQQIGNWGYRWPIVNGYYEISTEQNERTAVLIASRRLFGEYLRNNSGAGGSGSGQACIRQRGDDLNIYWLESCVDVAHTRDSGKYNITSHQQTPQ